MTATTHRPAGAPDTPLATAPSADCTADSAGGLSFDVALPGAAERWDAALLLRLRNSDPEESVRLPLVPLSDVPGGPGGLVLQSHFAIWFDGRARLAAWVLWGGAG
ncbi:hypothetical protein [Streptomyces megasporus]|uniref:hypothetical protein n=1 Tax=Streptomyces megasporus TaxID=44060 RepID=UPI00068D0DFB|nr:hypothetical protein [Streptomyces megasporus]